MRPIRLAVKGFTAFRDEQVVDFDGLDLVAIAGPTGSGKSSLLDAMTYALFGYVDRVGKQVGQLVSQGQPQMAVSLEFAVGEDRYRVTRRTPAARGATKILLERWRDGGWRQAGEGADRVREADAMIQDALGLDYAAFTRSVLLPQGTFAEFLVGDAKDRRKILTELLGLELFERLAKLAGEVRRASAAEAEAKAALLQTEYAGVTEEAAHQAEANAERAAEHAGQLAEAEAAVRQAAERWAATARSVSDLRTCAADLHDAADVAAGVAEGLMGVADGLRTAGATVAELTRSAAAADRDAAKAAAALAKAEAAWGPATELAALRVKAERLADLDREVDGCRQELDTARRAQPALAKVQKRAERSHAKAIVGAEAAMQALGSARQTVDDATHADLVAAVRAGVKVGDACPVCGHAVRTLPEAAPTPTLERAKAALAKVQQQAEAANEALRQAQTARDQVERDVRDAAAEAKRIEKELAKLTTSLDEVSAAVAGSFGGKLPADPVGALEERLERLGWLDEACAASTSAAAEARQAVADAERRLDALALRAGELRGRLDGLPVSGLLDRAHAAGGDEVRVPDLSMPRTTDDAPRLAEAAGDLSESLADLGKRLDDLATVRSGGEAAFLEQAQAVVGELVPPQVSLADLEKAVAEERRSASAAVASARKDAETLRTRLANARQLVEDVAAQRARAARFDALAKELRADRIIAFLQVEALQILAAAGSEHLSQLSGGRYRLAFEDDEFFVVDTWNGEEQRSARTLSGGETFLASLGLALALSEQVRSLSFTDKARLDSLFLDEGFGSLDPETLEVVVEAIEQLGGDGRMVGVITHVQELAIRLPARIEVEKSPRGSRLRVVT
ncbi:MAG TPA: SMC family ATPase [Actinomycetota bacterium]